MKGQIFILGALAITLAFFFAIPKFQQQIYLPDLDLSQLENIAKQYNKWIAYASIESYNILDFGEVVKDNYPNLEFVYLLSENQALKIVNFFDYNLSVTINGENLTLKPFSYEQTNFQEEINFTSNFVNFSYKPNHTYSGAIFLRINKGITELTLLKIFK